MHSVGIYVTVKVGNQEMLAFLSKSSNASIAREMLALIDIEKIKKLLPVSDKKLEDIKNLLCYLDPIFHPFYNSLVGDAETGMNDPTRVNEGYRNAKDPAYVASKK